MTEKFDPNNEQHKKIKYGIEIGNGLPPMPLYTEWQEALRKVGFENLNVTTKSSKMQLIQTQHCKLCVEHQERIGIFHRPCFIHDLQGCTGKEDDFSALRSNRIR